VPVDLGLDAGRRRAMNSPPFIAEYITLLPRKDSTPFRRCRTPLLCGISIPSTICTSPYLYRARNLVERFFNKIEHCRRVATRYDKLAANYLAFFQLASIRLWLRVNESTSWSLFRAHHWTTVQPLPI
jgi:transposase